MTTIVLPGLSNKNKLWLDGFNLHCESKEKLILHEWSTWKENSEFDIDFESERLLKIISDEDRVNIIAKSIGTKVLMNVIQDIKSKVGKVILCGIPVDPIGYSRGLKLIDKNNLLVIQNSHDPYMPYLIIKTYIGLIDFSIKVVKKESDTHDYPYYEDFCSWINN